MSEYNQLVQQIKDWKKNRDLAKVRGDKAKAKKYQYRIDAAEVKKIELESRMPKEILNKLEEKIRELEAANEAEKEKNDKLTEKINELENRLNMILNPPEAKGVVIIEEELTVCPNCKRAVHNMEEHQKKCLKSGATTVKKSKAEEVF